MSFENKEPTGALYSRHPFPNHPSHIVGARDYALKFLKDLSPKSMLFLGCGTGEEVVGVLSALKCECDVTCVEPNKPSFDIAKDNLEPLGAEVLNFDIESFVQQLDGGVYDFIWCSGVLHHTLNPAQNISLIRGLISNDGTFVLGMYHNARWKLGESDFPADVSESQMLDNTANPLEITMSWIEYMSFIKEAGFYVAAVTHKYRLPRPIGKVSCYIYDAIWLKRKIQMMPVICKPIVKAL